MEKETCTEGTKCLCGLSQDPNGNCDGSHVVTPQDTK